MADLFERISVIFSYVIFILFFPITVFFCLDVVMEYQRCIVFRLGRLRDKKPMEPGIFFFLPCIDSFEYIDLRIETIDIFPQEILSKDSVTVTVDGVIFYYIADPLKAVIQVHNYSYSTAMLGATILRNVLGTKDLKEILVDRKSMSEAIQHLLDSATDPWGVKVERVELQEIKLPFQMQRAMATEAEASREARAKVIAAGGELDASKMLKEASDIMTAGTNAVQLRYLQTLNTLSAEKKSTIIFPIPLDIIPPATPFTK